MHNNHPRDFYRTCDFNSGLSRHLVNHHSSAGMLRHDRPFGASAHPRNSPYDPLQWTANIVVDHHRVVDRGLPGAVDGAVIESCDLPHSTESGMATMRMAFAASGGLLTVGDLAFGNDPDSQTRFAQIAKGISTREILGFMWRSEPWMPMFQFDAGSRMVSRRALQPLFKLLTPLYDAWEMAHWFTRPNPWLCGLTPVDQCAGHLQAVLDVAKLEHFIATGQAPQQHRAAPRATCN